MAWNTKMSRSGGSPSIPRWPKPARAAAALVTLDRACWLVWPSERRSGVSAAMSQAQFVHFNAPVLAIQTGGRMEYFDEDRQLRWTSNLVWPRANLGMARLPGRASASSERSSGKASED